MSSRRERVGATAAAARRRRFFSRRPDHRRCPGSSPTPPPPEPGPAARHRRRRRNATPGRRLRRRPPRRARAGRAAQTDAAGIGLAQVLVTPPATPFRVGGGPYTVPITITNVSRISTITVTLTFDPALLRPRMVTEGGFMRSGGSNATFTNQIGNGRVDITIVRSADSTGATGTGLLGAVLFDAIAPGTSRRSG